MSFKIKGIVVEKESGKGQSGLVVKAYDKDFIYDDLLGSAETDQGGKFQITYEEKDFQDLFDSKPDIYLEIQNKKGDKIYSSEDAVRFGACAEEHFKVEIPSSLLPTTNNHVGEYGIDANYTSVDLRSLMVVLNRAVKKGKLEEIYSVCQEVDKANPKTVLLLPSLMLKALIPEFASLGLCTGTTATATVMMATATVLSNRRTVNFAYSYTGQPTCTVEVQSVRVAVGGIRMKVIKSKDTGSVYNGDIPRKAGKLPINSTATIIAKFKADADWCDTCNLPTPTIKKQVTIS